MDIFCWYFCYEKYWQNNKGVVNYRSCRFLKEDKSSTEKYLKKYLTWFQKCDTIYRHSSKGRKYLKKYFKKFEKKYWQTKRDVLEYKSCRFWKSEVQKII